MRTSLRRYTGERKRRGIWEGPFEEGEGVNGTVDACKPLVDRSGYRCNASDRSLSNQFCRLAIGSADLRGGIYTSFGIMDSDP